MSETKAGCESTLNDASRLATALAAALADPGPWMSAGDGGEASSLVTSIEELFLQARQLAELGPLLPVLLQALQDERLLFEDYDYRQRDSVADRAAYLLEQHSESTLPVFLDWLESPDEAQSRVACKWLKSNVGRALPALLTRFSASAQPLRYFAILDNAPGPRVAAALLAMHSVAAPPVRREIIRSLGWIFSRLYRSWLQPEAQDESTAFFREQVEPLLSQTLSDADALLRQTALAAIAEIGAPAQGLHRQVLEAAHGADVETLSATLGYFSAILTAAQLGDYLFLFEHPAPRIRLGAVDLLLPLVLPRLAPANSRIAQTRGLPRAEATALKRRLVETLIALLGDASAEVRLTTLQWLEQKPFQDARLSPALKAILVNDQTTEHMGMVLAENILGRQGSRGQKALAAHFQGKLEAPDPAVRRRSFAGLAQLTDARMYSLPAMLEHARQGLSDPDFYCRAEVARWLGQKLPPGAIPWLTDALGDEDSSVRDAAALALMEYGPRAREALATLLQRLERESRLHVRQSLVMALQAVAPADRTVQMALLKLRQETSSRLTPAFRQAEPAIAISLQDILELLPTPQKSRAAKTGPEIWLEIRPDPAG